MLTIVFLHCHKYTGIPPTGVENCKLSGKNVHDSDKNISLTIQRVEV